MSVRTPSYHLHKPSGQAVVTIDGRDHYLGAYRSTASHAEYDRIISEWLANGRQRSDHLRADRILREVGGRLLRQGWQADRRRPGDPISLRPLRKLYGHAQAGTFGPLAFKAVRQAMIDAGLCRNEVNKRARRVVRLFAWAVEHEMVAASVHHTLKTVPGLRNGRSGFRESTPVKPVPDCFVNAVRLYVARQVWAIVELQRLTGMRPGEVCQMRTCDLETSGRVWVYTPATHKTEHHDKERKVYLGPRAQAVVKPGSGPNSRPTSSRRPKRWKKSTRPGGGGEARP